MLVARGILVLALLLLAQQIPAAEPDEPADVAAMFAKMRANLARISSIEFTSGDSNKYYLDGVLQRTFEKETTFAYSSGKYRSRFVMNASDLAEQWQDNAYDGQRYQELASDRRILQRSSKPHYSAYGGPLLFFYPHSGVVRPGRPYIFERFLDEAVWNSVASDAVLEGEEEVDGHPCQVVRLKWFVFNKEHVRRVHLATDLEYLPIRIEFQDTFGQFSLRVTQCESRQTPAGRVVLAMAAESELLHEPGVRRNTTVTDRIVRQMWINADGLKINHEIPAERFTIPLDQVKRIIDED